MQGRRALGTSVDLFLGLPRIVRASPVWLAITAMVLAVALESDSQGATAASLADSATVRPSAALSHLDTMRAGIRDTGAAQAGMTRVDRYLSYDSSAKSVALLLIAAANSAQGGFNFNGGSAGNQTITVPLGWSIDVDFQNHDVVPHSAVVIADQSPLPAIPENPAFPRAYTSHLIDGLPAQKGHDTMQFTASKAGDYLIACGVPGHALSGMFIRFVVSAGATAPSDSGTIATQ